MRLRRLERLLIGVVLLVGLVGACRAAASGVASIFGDHMVLQRGRTVPVWGMATPGQTVTVSFAGQEKTATADSTGLWRVQLDPMTAAAEGNTMTIVCGAATNAFEDVVVGDVWFCSGQSNMALPVSRVTDAEQEIAAANYPLLRHNRGNWQVATPATAGGFSAAAYFFGRDLCNALKIPIGLINRSVGGTPIEYWMPEEALFKLPYAREMSKLSNTEDAIRELAEYNAKNVAYREALAARTKSPEKERQAIKFPARPVAPPSSATTAVYKEGAPGNLYRKMVEPVIPYGIRGFIWYQGERNSRLEGGSLAYRDLLPALIESWREAWGEGALPFLFVQLPNYKAEGWPLIRESMLKSLRVENTGMAVTIDVGEPGNIHPHNKQAVGQRLALLALKKVYGQDIVAESPVFESMTVEGNKAILTLRNVGGGLELRDAAATGFEIAGQDQVFHPAVAKVVGKDRLAVIAEQVAVPVAVRYAWASDPSVTLYNKEGLPASPFRTDAW